MVVEHNVRVHHSNRLLALLAAEDRHPARAASGAETTSSTRKVLAKATPRSTMSGSWNQAWARWSTPWRMVTPPRWERSAMKAWSACHCCWAIVRRPPVSTSRFRARVWLHQRQQLHPRVAAKCHDADGRTALRACLLQSGRAVRCLQSTAQLASALLPVVADDARPDGFRSISAHPGVSRDDAGCATVPACRRRRVCCSAPGAYSIRQEAT